MGDTWWLYRGDKHIQWGKNEEPLELLTVFIEDDKYVDEGWIAAVARLEGHYGPDDEEQELADQTITGEARHQDVFGYCATAGAVRARLALMGFTAAACRHEWSSAIDEMLADDEPGGDFMETDKDGNVLASIPRSQILDRGLTALESEIPYPLLEPLTQRCLDLIVSFLDAGDDQRTLLALQLESTCDDVNIRLDLHDLYLAGYFVGVDNITQVAANELAVSVSSGEAIIVITEGVTDARYLKRALELVAPHVSHMFRFFDKDAGAEMGATQVMRTLRSFAAAGVANRVIGVLDNDAAGRAAAKHIEARPRPANNRYILLPDVPYGTAYPTNGPSGDADLDVNGRAVSIEFQFGLEQLRVEDGELAKVEWSGREASIGVYQGSLSKKDKEAVQRNIQDFLDLASPHHDPLTEPWPAVHALVSRLLKAAVPGAFPGQHFTADRKKMDQTTSRP